MSRGAKQTNARLGSDPVDNSATDAPSDAGEMSWLDEEIEDEQVGRVIDNRYKLQSLLGQGGMGSVYKAEHLGIRRTVAVKLLHPTLASVPEVSRRFEREAFAIGRIEHPNCVDVMDFGQLEDGSLYLVMEYLQGHSLGDELADRERVEPGRALHILRHILRGLQHAHENDIVHRDIKPENVVLVTQNGDPDFAKILDFGIAKLMGSAAEDDGGVKLTQAGMAFGTPVYMSPEQAVGNPVDGRADLYAASVMAYEMVTGHPPFHSDDKIEIMSMHTTRPVPIMSDLVPGLHVPADVENVIAKGLAKRPSDRYATAGDYIEAIETVLAGGSVEAPIDTLISGQHARAATAMTAQMTQELAELQGLRERSQRRTRMLVRAGLMIAALALIGLAIAFSMGGDGSSESGDPSTLAARASDLLDKGDPKGAIDLLTKQQAVVDENAAALVQLGHAYERNREDLLALGAYKKALELDRSLTEDSALKANLNIMRDGEDGMAAVEACDILATRFDDQVARDKLVEFASRDKRRKIRAKAVQVVAAHGLSERVDWVDSYMLDLVQGKNCKARREMVSKLRATGDKRAIPALKKAAYRKGRRGKYKGKKINRCLKQEALEAVEHLEALHAEPPPDAEPPT